MFKRLLTAALITSMLILPVSSVGPAGAGEAPDYLPGDVPAQTDAVESMSPALHALVLAMVNHDVKSFDFDDRALTWEVPILDGIQALSQGAEVHLNEQGELAEINAGLNHTGAALRQKDHTRSDWIRGISHDIRTPLSVILGYASDMEDDACLPASTRKQAAVIRRQGEKLRALVADLNLSTKLEYGTLPLKKQRIDPVELERRVVSEFLNHGLPETFAIRVSAEAFDTPFPLRGDLTLLHRMLCNLVSNSIVHNPNGCEIELSVSTVGNCCVFSVADTGRGMEDWQIEKLNADESIGSMQPGDMQEEHGLGLKIVRQIAKAHQGKAIFSKNVPRGLCVKVEIAAE